MYQCGESKRKILLEHGWSGRGTQLLKSADELLQNVFLLLVLMRRHTEHKLKAIGVS